MLTQGFNSALHNPRNSDEAKAHAQNELNQLSDTPERNEDQRHEGNVKRGLKAYEPPLNYPVELMWMLAC